MWFQSRGSLYLVLFCAAVFSTARVGYASHSTTHHPKLKTKASQEGYQRYLAHEEDWRAYKVFVISDDGAWAWLERTSYEGAIRDTTAKCNKHARQKGCRLFAVGNTVVVNMTREGQQQVVKKYGSQKSPSSIETEAPLHSAALAGFKAYQLRADSLKYKVFVLSDDGDWSYQAESTYEEALEVATDRCDAFASRRGLCQIFAVGDVVIWDLPETEKQAVIGAYRVSRGN